MDVIEIGNISSKILQMRLLGIGSTTICFKYNDEVVKIFKPNYPLLREASFIEKIENFNLLANDSYIVPQKWLIYKGKIIGYTHAYIKAPTLSRINSNTRISELFKNYDKLIDDTRKISNAHLKLQDMHKRNILFDGNYYIIDLDRCKFLDASSDFIFGINMCTIFNTILRQIHNIGGTYRPIYLDQDFSIFINQLDKGNIDDIEKFLKKVSDKCLDVNPSVDKIRRMIKIEK